MRVVIAGLGTAGSAVAALCAERGLEVVGVDGAALDAAGARWTNGVPAWAYDAAGLPRPTAPELRSGPVPYHLVAGWRGPQVTVRSVLEVDMRPLTARLQARARAAGAELRGDVRVRGVDGGVLQTSDGPVRGDVFVDATGYAGRRLMGQPRLDRRDLCAATQEVRRVTDRAAAQRFFADRGARPGEVVCFTGVAGGYSILNVRLDGDEVGLLTGTLPALGHPSGRSVMDRFVAEQTWIGAPLFGGSRAIPLRRSWEVVGAGHLALVGDSACQVFASHGSGIAQQLLAARLLADTLAAGGTPWDYNVAWQRRHGALLAGSDLFRRFSQGLSQGDLAALIRRRVLSPPMMADTMDQRPVRPPLLALLRAMRGLGRLPGLAGGLLPVLARMRALERWYARYPEQPAGLRRWQLGLRRLTGQAGWSPPHVTG